MAPNPAGLTELAMTTTPEFPLDGGCDCRQVRYRMGMAPLFTHCCHCILAETHE